jgi:glycosyltransferase involved in cell wall biosynthesis
VCLCANTTWYVVNFRARLIEALVADGLKVVVVSPTDRYVERLEALGAVHVPMRIANAGTNPAAEILSLLRLASTLSRLRPSMVLTWTPKVNIYVSLAARALAIPVVANVSGLGRASISGGWLARVTHLLYRAALRWPRTVFFQNRDDLAAFVHDGLVDAARTRRLPGSGVDTTRFRPAPRTGSERPCFLLVARLMWDKGVGEFVEAARLVKSTHPDARFCLAGFVDVDNPSAISRSVVASWESEGLIEYLGSFDDMVPVYSGAACVVLPSYREGMPRSLLEAAAMGKPVITTDVPGCREAVVPGTTGWLVPARDARALAGAMIEFLDTSAAERDAMGLAARARVVAQFDETVVIDAYRSVIHTALSDVRHTAVT